MSFFTSIKYKLVPGSRKVDLRSTDISSPWRPWFLRPPFLISFAILCVFLSIALEVIVHGCSDGCHVFGAYSSVKVTGTTHFIYTQLPTVLGLILSLLWALPHHNVMRLEPYFRMSAPGGATASDSIFLTYPYIFAPFVPYEAGKRRHYVVLTSSCITLFINFLLTPLISGIFNEGSVQVQIPGHATRGTIRPGSGHNNTLSSSFSYVAYEYVWGGGALPPFTTPTYALLPIQNLTAFGNGSETWTAETTLFEADLTCAPALANSSVWRRGITIDSTPWNRSYNLRICNTFGPADANEDLCGGWTTFLTPWTTIALPGNHPGVWTNESQVYMFAFASGGVAPSNSSLKSHPPPAEITAVFCKSTYYSQSVTADVKMPSGEIQKISPKGERTVFELPDLDRVVNAVNNTLGTPSGAKNSAGELVAFGYLPPLVPNVDSQLRRRLGGRPENELFGESLYDRLSVHDPSSHSAVFMGNVHSISGMAMAHRTKDNLQEMLDPEVLAAEYKKALQLWFSLVVALEMVDVDAGSVEAVDVMRHVSMKGYRVDRLWARGAQGGLVAVAAMVVVLSVLIRRRRCMLDGEPNSIAESLRLLAVSPELSEEMENAEFYSPEDILKVFDSGKGRYILEDSGEGARVRAVGVQEHAKLLAPSEENRKPWMEKLWPLRTGSGVVFLAFFGVVVVLLAAAFAHSQLHDGIPSYAPVNSFWYKVLFTYVPIVVGMATEPVLLSIAICQCMLAPYKVLESGPAASSKSVAVDYDRSPPHFQLLPSIQSGNVVLAALTVTILLSNVLAVALAGLFSGTPAMFEVTTKVHTYAEPKIQGTFTELAHEMYYILAEELSDLTDAPEWTNDEYYVLPVDLVDRTNIARYEVSTLGIGVDIKCDIVPQKDIILECAGNTGGCSTPQTELPSGVNILKVHDPCWVSYASKRPRANSDHEWDDPTNDSIFQSLDCPDKIYVAWLERPANPDPGNGTIYQDRLDALVLKCSAVDKVVELTATMNDRNRVISTVPSRRLDSQEVAALYSEAVETTLHADFVIALLAGLTSENINPGARHQIRWLNYLIATVEPRTIGQSTNITHIPDAKYIASAFEDVYRRLFAINVALYAKDTILPRDPRPEIDETSVKARALTARVYMSSEMFYLAVAILLFMIGVLGALYWGQRQPIGHLPESLAGTYALLYASNAKEECGKLRGRNSKERSKKLEEQEIKFMYGSFLGGRHYGVYCVGEEVEADDSEGEI